MFQLIKSPNTLYLALILFAFIIHIPYIPNGFTWLEHRDIEQKRAVLPLTGLPKAFFTRYGDTGFYRPAVKIANSVDYAVYKQFAPGFHLTNLLLFTTIIAVLPFFLTKFFTLSRNEALLTTLIVAVHPLGFLPVGSISYRPELLLMLFTVLTIYFHIKYREAHEKKYMIFAVLSFTAGLFSKETALFLLPALIIFWEIHKYCHRERLKGARRSQKTIRLHQSDRIGTRNDITKRGSLRLFFIELFVIIGYVILRFHAVPELWRTAYSFTSLSTAIGTRLYAVGKLMLYFFSPLIPRINDAVPITPVISVAPVTTGFFILILLIFIFRKGIRSKTVFTIIFFLLCLAPAFSIIPVPRLGSPHYGFIALIPFSTMMVITFHSLVNKPLKSFLLFRREGQASALPKQGYSLQRQDEFQKKLKQSLLPIILIWFLIAIYSTLQNGNRFNNDETLFAPEVKDQIYYPEAHFYLGNYYFTKKDYEKAEKAYHASLKKKPRCHCIR